MNYVVQCGVSEVPVEEIKERFEARRSWTSRRAPRVCLPRPQ